MDGWMMDGWLGGWMEGRTGGYMNIHRDQLPCKAAPNFPSLSSSCSYSGFLDISSDIVFHIIINKFLSSESFEGQRLCHSNLCFPRN